MADRKYHGHMTQSDGTHVLLTEDEAANITRLAHQQQEKRATDMPDATSALSVICNAMQRMRELGWKEAKYCPKDGSAFAVCEFGSSGIWRGVKPSTSTRTIERLISFSMSRR
jgi:hypothetical protein